MLVALGVNVLFASAYARGPSPYLPLNLSPEIEWQIQQVLILADKPILKRPIPAATVAAALPHACAKDPVLCEAVGTYLRRYMRNYGVTDLSVEFGSSADSAIAAPNQRGESSDSEWRVHARTYWQPSDYVILTLAGHAHADDVTAAGSMLSLGTGLAQLDIGFRDRWLSPLSDSSWLISTEAPTMPSITLSNNEPISRLGLYYELFVAEMSRSDRIVFEDGFTQGRPRLAGVHLAIEPVSGWSMSVNRLLQFGGGSRPGSFSDFIDAFFDPVSYDNVNPGVGDNEFGNQTAAITSSFIYPGKTPFAAYIEYAGEDSVRGRYHLLGNAALSIGMHWPRLPGNLDLVVEASEWQNAWYVHHLYRDGMINDGRVIGHWAGDHRVFGDDVVGRSAMVRLGWRPTFGGLMALRYRVIQNEDYSAADYDTGYELGLAYSRKVGPVLAGLELVYGQDVFGEDLSQIRAYARISELAEYASFLPLDSATNGGGELFIDAGANVSRVQVDERADAPRMLSSWRAGAHVGVGARRIGRGASDIGVRLELDDVEGRVLASVRAIDYRYRFGERYAASFFLGASRYDLATPAYGLYYGVGVQWRNIVDGWDLAFDARFAEKVSRDYVRPDDPVASRPNAYYDIYGGTLYVSRRF